MFADPSVITYNAVAKNCNRINQDNGGSDYYLDDGTNKYSLSIRHTIPSKGGTGESHMIRLDIDRYDAQNVYLRRDSVWFVAKTTDGVQVTQDLNYLFTALKDFMNASSITKLLAREN